MRIAHCLVVCGVFGMHRHHLVLAADRFGCICDVAEGKKGEKGWSLSCERGGGGRGEHGGSLKGDPVTCQECYRIEEECKDAVKKKEQNNSK